MAPNTRDWRPPDDEIGRRLRTLGDDLERELADHAVIERGVGEAGVTTLRPKREGSLAVSWTDFGDDLQLDAHTGGGGRLEFLGRTLEDVELIEEVVRAIVDGRACELRGPGRSRLVVTDADGTLTEETGHSGLAGCLPRPFWTRHAERIDYRPYV